MKRLGLHIYIMFMALTAMACQSNEVEATPSDKISKHNEHHDQWKNGFVPAR